MVSVSRAPKSWTFFWWQDGQNQRPSCLAVARRAKEDAGEGEQVVFLAVIAADAGEPALQIAAVHKLVHHLGDDGTQVTMP